MGERAPIERARVCGRRRGRDDSRPINRDPSVSTVRSV